MRWFWLVLVMLGAAARAAEPVPITCGEEAASICDAAYNSVNAPFELELTIDGT